MSLNDTKQNSISTGAHLVGSQSAEQNARAESDKLRREIMEKKAQIDLLEREASHVSEIKSFLIGIIEDFQATGKFHFYNPETEDLEDLLKNPKNGIDILRKGINGLIDKHQNLCRRFESQMQNNLATIQCDLNDAKRANAKEAELLELARQDQIHKQDIIKYLEGEKSVLQRTILMRTAALDRREVNGLASIQALSSQFEKTQQTLNETRNVLQEKRKVGEILTRKQQERLDTEEEQRQNHAILVQKVEKLRKEFKDEAFEHNKSQSNLDHAKAELEHLTAMVGSYRDNLKTQELLGEEAENRRQHSNFKIERAEAERKQKKEEKKTAELEKKVAVLASSIAKLNEQIAITEQKLQMQMIKIPDFQQLHQALDRSLAMSKKFRDQVMDTKYMLDEIREKNRALEQMEIHESKVRTAQYRVPLPPDVPHKKPENRSSSSMEKKEVERTPEELDMQVSEFLREYDVFGKL